MYFDKKRLIPELVRVLKPNGQLFILFMTWLAEEDEIVRNSFALVKRYNPEWSGYMKRTESFDPPWLNGTFTVDTIHKQDVHIPFTHEAWCDRMVASRGIGATLNDEQSAMFRKELLTMLKHCADEAFTVLHEAVIIKLTKETST